MVSGKVVSQFNIDIIKDYPPEVKFISKPESKWSGIKFSSSSKDDYGLEEHTLVSKPEGYEHFKDKFLSYELSITNSKSKVEAKVIFMRI